MKGETHFLCLWNEFDLGSLAQSSSSSQICPGISEDGLPVLGLLKGTVLSNWFCLIYVYTAPFRGSEELSVASAEPCGRHIFLLMFVCLLDF